MKKLLSLLLVMIMIVALAVPAYAANDEIIINFPSVWVGTDSKAPYMAQLIENEIHAPRHPDNYDFWTNLALLEFSHSSVIRRGAKEFLKIIEDGRSRFSPAYFRQYANLSHGECRNIIRSLLDKKLVTATGGITRTRRYDIAPIAFEGRG